MRSGGGKAKVKDCSQSKLRVGQVPKALWPMISYQLLDDGLARRLVTIAANSTIVPFVIWRPKVAMILGLTFLGANEATLICPRDPPGSSAISGKWAGVMLDARLDAGQTKVFQ